LSSQGSTHTHTHTHTQTGTQTHIQAHRSVCVCLCLAETVSHSAPTATKYGLSGASESDDTDSCDGIGTCLTTASVCTDAGTCVCINLCALQIKRLIIVPSERNTTRAQRKSTYRCASKMQRTQHVTSRAEREAYAHGAFLITWRPSITSQQSTTRASQLR
jgi:hypothetical protein